MSAADVERFVADLKTDPDDRKNLASKHPEKVAKLSKLIDEWLEKTPQMHK